MSAPMTAPAPASTAVVPSPNAAPGAQPSAADGMAGASTVIMISANAPIPHPAMNPCTAAIAGVGVRPAHSAVSACCGRWQPPTDGGHRCRCKEQRSRST
jgi:hypothetical protein